MSSGTAAMPSAVFEVFDPLKNELISIHTRWALYKRVFGFDEARIDLLNRIADVCFGYTQWAIYRDVLLSLCRYTDLAESSKTIGRRPNLTLQRLVNAVTADDAGFGSRLETGEWNAVKSWRDNHFEEIRSKRIAHNDLTKMVARFNGPPMGWPSREQVERFLTLCTQLMNRVHERYIGCQFMFQLPALDAEASANKLVKVLTEFAEKHDADVMAGRRTWAIQPSAGFFRGLASGHP
jgi:hypothetical protein